MSIWQLCANLLIPNCLRSNLSYSPLAALELYVKITKTPTYTEKASTQGKAIVVSNGDQAVAFEVRKQTGSEENLIMGETVYFSNSFDFFVPRTVSMAGCGLYAVQADGTRILMKRTN